jgi:hypothetical protein
LLANNDANVIIVHWGGGANTNYDHAHANIRLVGLEVAFLVNTMIVSFFTSSLVFKKSLLIVTFRGKRLN